MANSVMQSIAARRRPVIRPEAPGSSAPGGRVRLGLRTKELAPQILPGEVAVIRHEDLDAVAARALVQRFPAAVLNDRPSASGRYPNRGPAVLLAAGVPLFDVVHGETSGDSPVDLFDCLSTGDVVQIRDGTLFRGNSPLAAVQAVTVEALEERLRAGRANLGAELSAFAKNTMHFLAEEGEQALLLDAVELPLLRTEIRGRPVLVAVRGEHYEADIQRLGPYLREQRPVVIAVDGAADTLRHAGVRPDIILGDMDSVSDSSLRCGAELVVHAYARPRAEGAAPGLARIQALGLQAHLFPVAGTSEDAALLLAYEYGADLIVAVGTHSNLEDFLDKGRNGMASTFLVRLKVGSRLVDARGVSRLYKSREPAAPMLSLLLLSAMFPVLALLLSTMPGQVAWRSLVLWIRMIVP